MKVQIQNQIIEFVPKWSEQYEWIAVNQNGVISIFTDKPTFYGNEWIEGDEINDVMETLNQTFKGKITKAWQMVYRLGDVKVTEEHKPQTFQEAFEELLNTEAPTQKLDITFKKEQQEMATKIIEFHNQQYFVGEYYFNKQFDSIVTISHDSNAVLKATPDINIILGSVDVTPNELENRDQLSRRLNTLPVKDKQEDAFFKFEKGK